MASQKKFVAKVFEKLSLSCAYTPSTMNTMMMVNGMFLNNSTYPLAIRRNDEIGEIRISSRITPRIVENSADHRVSSMFTRNAPGMSYWLNSCANAFIASPLP